MVHSNKSCLWGAVFEALANQCSSCRFQLCSTSILLQSGASELLSLPFEDLEKCPGFDSRVWKWPLKCHRSVSWLSRLLLPPITFLWHCPTVCAKQACVVFTLIVKGKYKVILEEEEGTKQEKCNFSDLLDYSYTRDLSPCLPLWRTLGKSTALRFVF